MKKPILILSGIAAGAVAIAALAWQLGGTANADSANENRGLIPTVQAEASALTVTETGVEDPYKDEPNFSTYSLFHDVLRGTHIAVGNVTAVTTTRPDNLITFEPSEYLMGDPLATTSIDLISGVNSDLSELVGQRVVLSFIETPDGEYGLTHGVHSLTPDHFTVTANGVAHELTFGVDTSIAMYKQLLLTKAEYGEVIDVALAANPEDGNFELPSSLVGEWAYTLVQYLGESNTRAADHAGRTLYNEPVFKNALTEDMLGTIKQHVVTSEPQSYDRGWMYMLLAREGSELRLHDVMQNVRDEVAKINLDHIAEYLHEVHDEEDVVTELANIYTSVANTVDERRNAVIVAGQFGSRQSLPYLHQLLGNVSGLDLQRELLNTLYFLRSEESFTPLVNYINGGTAVTESGKQRDVLENRELYKRAIRAIAVIDSEHSNLYLRQAYTTVKEENATWVREFMWPLLPQNKHWRELVMIHEVDPVPFTGIEVSGE